MKAIEIAIDLPANVDAPKESGDAKEDDAPKEDGDAKETRMVRLKASRDGPADVPLPPCPYNEETKIDEGVRCYIHEGCPAKFYSWDKLLIHVKQYHGVKQAEPKRMELGAGRNG